MNGKVVLITGASSGIGAGTASHFASLGCLLALTGRSIDGLEESHKACLEAGAKDEDILLIPADLMDTSNLPSIVQKTIDKFGKLDVLINNAGYSKIMDFATTTEEEYDMMMNTNLKSVFFLTQSAMPYLIQSKGNVVNVSSVAGQRPMTIFAPYCLSKAGLDHFTRVLALDVAIKGVRVNCVGPGMIKTQIFDKIGLDGGWDDQLAARSHAIGRGGSVEEMAKSIAFLADNNQASFVTGVVMLVDGGASLMGPM